MSKKTSQPSTSPQPAGGVDFLYRTMIEREATGKRRIRPKNVDDLDFLQSTLQDESDDPDFDCKDEDSDSEAILESDEEDERSNNSGSDQEKGENQDDESDESDEDYQEGKEAASGSSDNDSGSESSSGSSSNESDNSDSDDEPEIAKKSALRESLQKFNDDTNNFMAKKPPKKKRKVGKSGEKSSKTASTSKNASQNNSKSESQSSKSKNVKPKTKKLSKVSKGKKGLVLKKPKVVNKKSTSIKKKNAKKSEEKLSKSAKPSVMSLMGNLETNLNENRKEIGATKPICSACLKDNSDDSNEIVECDSCGISVHETCYGLSVDNVSISSGSGSSSCTEPWFCDVCKSGVENISCELCPVEGGLFKESTSGRWVHLVCALYTPGVVVHHDSSINLYAIHYTRWGSHNCAACENERSAQTGIVICCDAGMCKTHFHATCAQRLGLLSDTEEQSQLEFQAADPYFVSCKMHLNRETMKRRIKLYNTLQEQLRIKKLRKDTDGLPSGASADHADHARILRKLEKVRLKTANKRMKFLQTLENVPPVDSTLVDQTAGLSLQQNKLPESWVNKKQRMLHTSAKLGRDFLKKTVLIGDDVAAEELEVKHEKIVSNVKRKWNVLPAMSVEFAGYYTDRERRISSLLDQHDKSVKENQALMDKEASLTDVLDTQEVNREAMAAENETVSKQLVSLANILKFFMPGDKQFSTKLNSLVKIKDSPGGRRKSPSVSRGDRKSPSPRRSSVTGKKSPGRGKSAIIKVCDVCSKSDNQHLITICDKCRRNFHLGCLDPPLDRMPKRTRLCGWICSDCGEAASGNEGQVDTEAPRTLRGRTKIHKPRKYRGSDDSDIETKFQPQSDALAKKSSPKFNAKVALPTESPQLKVFNHADSGGVESPSETNLTERRRRSSSVVSPMNGPNLVINGPTTSAAVELQLPSIISSVTPLSAPEGEVNVASTSKSKPVKKKKLATPKPPKLPKVPRIQADKVKIKNKGKSTSVKGSVTSSVKRKSDGPLTSYKVNGINESNVLTKVEDGLAIAPPKPKRTKKKKKEGIVVNAEEMSKNGMSVGDMQIPVSVDATVNVINVKVKPVKPKKPKIKKEAKIPIIGVALQNSTEQSETKPVKVKKPRKKKEPKELNINGSLEITNSDAPKKVKKKVTKPRISTLPPSVVVATPRQEENGVNQIMGKVTTQLIVDKQKNAQNGTVKTTKKRKSSTGLVQPINETIASPSFPEVKEKMIPVPPKKRKRAPSNAQSQQQASSNVDSIIHEVSCGISERKLENGDHNLNSSSESTIMRGIAPRQLAPEQNIMQGKQMGSGVSSGEMVTVDASFLLDFSPSNESNYAASSVPSYYASSSGNQPNHVNFQNEVHGTGNHVASNSRDDNVIRLQYEAEVSSSSTSDSSAMPPPAHPPVASPNMFSSSSGVCATCTKADGKIQLVMCDKCQLEFHFMCLIPPMKFNPRRKGHPWFCKNCDDGEPMENGIVRHLQ